MAPIAPFIAFDRAAANRLYNDNLLRSSFTKSRADSRVTTTYSSVTEGYIQENGVHRLVVLKTFRGQYNTPPDKIAQRTYREALAWAQLAKSPLRCDNINTFHGVIFIGSDVIKDVVDTSIPSIVTDFVRYDAIEYTISRSFTNRLEVVRQLANGVSHLHSLNLVHGDLKPDNVRVTEEGVVKIIDLGLSRLYTTQSAGYTTTVYPTFRFIAPELIEEEDNIVYMSVTKPTDVYAFSMTALQVLDGQGARSLPFNNLKVDFDVRLAVLKSQWPESHRYGGVPLGAWDILSCCWTDPSSRPSIDALLKALSAY